LREILPEKIRLRKSKLGFATPERKWIEQVISKDMKSAFETARFLSHYVNIKQLGEMYDGFLYNNSFRVTQLLFRSYILELWGRKFILNNCKT